MARDSASVDETAKTPRAPRGSTDEACSPTGLYQVLREDGTLVEGRAPALSDERLVELYRAMVGTRVMDQRMMNLQRQGRIGFYGVCHGQEAATIASAFALEARDWLFPALRETPAAILRGYPLEQAVAQCVGSDYDRTHGRQMPCHPSWKASHVVSMSPVMATQFPQAAGAAHAARIRKDRVVVIAYIGDGATSEPDFACGMNFAGVYQLPLILFCQNNQWAISTAAAKQTASATIAVKAKGYGIEGVRVDGNDALAVYEVTKRAADKAREGGGPTFVEALTYRLGPHSSSDDPSRYRDEAEVETWRARDPLLRMRRFLEGRGLWDAAREDALDQESNARITGAIEKAESCGPPPPESLFEDVYARPPWHLQEQLAEVQERLHGNLSS